MGRPLNPRFFQSGTSKSGFQIGCEAWFTGEGAFESAYIIRQRSRSRYLVGSDAGGATPTRTEVLTLVNDQPAAAGEMRVQVIPELILPASEATFTIDTDGTGAVSAGAVIDGGSGYFRGGIFSITSATLAGNDDAVVALGVAVGAQTVIILVVIAGGTGYTINQVGVPVNTADVPDPLSSTVVDSAKIISANRVKTFANERFVWPAIGGVGSGSTAFLPQADLGAAT